MVAPPSGFSPWPLTVCRWVVIGLLLGLTAARSEPPGPPEKIPHQPAFNRAVIDRHRQIFSFSCIPSSVEMVLKLLGRVPSDYYSLQQAWKNKTDGNFDNFEQRTIAGVTFHRQFATARCVMFPLKGLFAAIDAELAQGRYVIVGLSNDRNGYHAWVIVERLPSGEYRAISKSWEDTIEITDTKRRIEEMQGTDLGTYTLDSKDG